MSKHGINSVEGSLSSLFSFFFLLLFPFAISLFPSPAFAYYTNQSASVVVGQTNFTSASANQGGSTSSVTLSAVVGQAITIDNKLVVADASNNRVLIYNTIPTSNNASADLVIGQPDLTSSSNNQCGCTTPAANTLWLPHGLATDGKKLFVADSNNHRILIYNQLPTVNNISADVVVGQPSFASRAASWAEFNNPQNISIADGKLFVADYNQNRVLIWNTVPTVNTNSTTANVVIGQTSLLGISANQGGSVGANTLRQPFDVLAKDGKLFVTDRTNHRVLIWNSIPTSNNVSADTVIGQSNFTNSNANQGGSVAANTLNAPIMLFVDSNRLYIADALNNRVLIYNSIPTSNNVSADIVLGQENFTQNSANPNGVTASSLNIPFGLKVINNKLYVSDQSNNRLLIFSNTLPDTKLTNVLVSGEADGKQKLQGKASTNVVNGVVRYVEYSINGSTWTGADPSDGAFDEVEEDYSFVFDPKGNNPDTTKNVGFVVRVRNTHNNTVDSGSSAVYFEPFVSRLERDPQGKPLDSNQSFGTNPLPSFSFSINTWRFEDLVKDLDSFRVSINKDNQGWIPYLENIPVSYEGVRDIVDNKRRSIVATSGNGVYEDKGKVVSYTSNNGTIAVQGKAVNRATGEASDKDFFNGGMKLPAGTYQWRIEALDRAGHVQATGEKTLYMNSFQKIVTKRWFPLTITSFSGVSSTGVSGGSGGSSLDWSSIHPQDVPSSLTITTTQPMIKGIASVGATVTLQATNKICLARGGSSASCTISSSTVVGGDSRYTLTSPILLEGNDYMVMVSVSDVWGNGNRLPGMSVGVE